MRCSGAHNSSVHYHFCIHHSDIFYRSDVCKVIKTSLNLEPQSIKYLMHWLEFMKEESKIINKGGKYQITKDKSGQFWLYLDDAMLTWIVCRMASSHRRLPEDEPMERLPDWFKQA